jgi:hypothetical protein
MRMFECRFSLAGPTRKKGDAGISIYLADRKEQSQKCVSLIVESIGTGSLPSCPCVFAVYPAATAPLDMGFIARFGRPAGGDVRRPLPPAPQGAPSGEPETAEVVRNGRLSIRL